MGKKIWGLLTVFLLLALVFFSPSLPAVEIGKAEKIAYLGHAAFKLVSPQGAVIYIDPLAFATEANEVSGPKDK